MHHPSSCKLVWYNFSSPKDEFLPLVPDRSMKIWQTSHTWGEEEGQQPSHCSNADVYPCYPLMLSCCQFFYNSIPTHNPHSQAGSTKGWVGMGTNWCKCLWDNVTSVPRSHLCRETLRRLLHTYLRIDKSKKNYTWFLWNIVSISIPRKLRGGWLGKPSFPPFYLNICPILQGVFFAPHI